MHTNFVSKGTFDATRLSQRSRELSNTSSSLGTLRHDRIILGSTSSRRSEFCLRASRGAQGGGGGTLLAPCGLRILSIACYHALEKMAYESASSRRMALLCRRRSLMLCRYFRHIGVLDEVRLEFQGRHDDLFSNLIVARTVSKLLLHVEVVIMVQIGAAHQDILGSFLS